MPARITLLLLFLLWASPTFSQIIYLVTGVFPAELVEVDLSNGGCNTTVIGELTTASGIGIAAIDVAVCPDGSMYVSNGLELYSIDPSTAQATLVGLHGAGIIPNSLTCSDANVLYGAGLGLYLIDPNTGMGTNLGPLPTSAAGDLVFQGGSLYYSTFFGIYEINIGNPSGSTLVMPSSLGFWGLTAVNEVCNVLIGGVAGGQLVTVDLNTQSETTLCTLPWVINGLASYEEFTTPPGDDCTQVELDLDDNDSSGAVNADYQALNINCDNLTTAIADEDAVLFAIQSIASMSITLTNALDGPQEFLSLGFIPNLLVTGSGTGMLSITNSGLATNADFLAALQAVLYQNTALPVTPGLRQVEVFFELYTGIQSNVATAFIQVEPFSGVIVDLGPDLGICPGESVVLDAGNPGAFYNWSTGASTPTITVTSPGQYAVTVTDADGCVGTDMVNVSFNPTAPVQLVGLPGICQGESTFIQVIIGAGVPMNLVIEESSTGTIFEFFNITSGFAFPVMPDMTTVYVITSLEAPGGMVCPQIVGGHLLQVSFDQTLNQVLEICEGETVLLEGAQQSTAGVYTDQYLTAAGCDSTVITTLIVHPLSTTEFESTTCVIGEAGTFQTVVPDSNGCDSTIIETVTYVGSNPQTLFETTCDPAAAGVEVSVFLNIFGCDSVVTTITEWLPSDTTAIFMNTCDPSQAGTTTELLTNSFGCDSLVIISTLLDPTDTLSLQLTTCDPAAAGLVVDTFSNQFGCDSLVFTETLLFPSDTTLFLQTSCDPNQTGIVETLLTNGFGCDSLVITETLFSAADTTQLFFDSCDPAAVGVSEALFTNAEGCDSLVITTVSLVPSDTVLLFDTSCDPAATGVFESLFVNQFGCDSLVVETVTFAEADTTLLFAQSCEVGDTGVFEVLLVNALGCDSLVIETVSLLPSDTTAVFSESCDPTAVGVFETLLVNTFGCDSLVVETVSLLPSDTTAVFSESCDPTAVGVFETLLVNTFGCDSLVIETVSLLPSDTTAVFSGSCDPSEVGVFETLLVNTFGCDSLVVETVSLLPGDTTAVFSESCDPSEVGVFETLLVNTFGCDSLVVETVSLLPGDTTAVFSESCDPSAVGVFETLLLNTFGCDSLVVETVSLLPGDTTAVFSESCDPSDVGVFETLLVNTFGCDSLVVETVSLLPSDTTAVFSESCDPSEVGVFETLLVNTFGCDSLVVETVSLLPGDESYQFFTSCDPDALGLDTLFFTNSLGCDSLVIQETVLAAGDTCLVDVDLSFEPIPCAGDTWTANLLFTTGIGPATLVLVNLDNGTQSTLLLDLNTPTVIDQLQAGTYSFQLTTQTGIVWTETLTVLAPEPLALDLALENTFGGFAVPCFGAMTGTVAANATGGTPPYSYSWSNGANGPVAGGFGAGPATLLLSDAAGCTTTATLILEEPPALLLDILGLDPLCFGTADGLIELLNYEGGLGPYQFTLNDISVDPQDFPLENLSAGNYTLAMEDANGCRQTATLFLTDPFPVQVDLGPDQEVPAGTEIHLDYNLNLLPEALDSLFWTGTPCPDCTEQTITAFSSAWYSLEVFSVEGCTATDSLYIAVLPTESYVPNAFSPNDDGVNDWFYLYPGPDVALVQRFQIFDRWGENVFTRAQADPNDLLSGWDGRFRGKRLNSGVYVYYFELLLKDGRVEILKGDVLLMR